MKSKNKTLCVFGTRPEVIKMAWAVNPYGDGKAAGRIVRALADEPTSRVRSPGLTG